MLYNTNPSLNKKYQFISSKIRNVRDFTAIRILILISVIFLPLSNVVGNNLNSAARAESINSQSKSTFLPLITNHLVYSGNYYVDSISGSDDNPGTTPDLPWQSLMKVQDAKLKPGDVIHFKRNCVWTGSLYIHDSGLPGFPITFTSYGDGALPILHNPGDSSNRTKAILIDANWIVVENIKLQDIYLAGVQVLRNSMYNVIRSIEVTRTGFGVVLEGQHNQVTNSYIHDLHIVNNTPGGTDDYGAVGVSIENSNNEVSYNRFINCRAQCYDYGFDGGAVEWWRNADNVTVHHNWASGNAGFLEVGGGSARNASVAYNVSYNNGRFAAFHLDGQYVSSVENFQMDNNTIIETAGNARGWDIFWFSSTPFQNTVLLQNNIIYADWFSTVANKSGFTHTNNLYDLRDGTTLNFQPGPGELIGDPQFVDLLNQNFKLQSYSPAINAGMLLSFLKDFNNQPVPVGPAPDLGAFEYQGP